MARRCPNTKPRPYVDGGKIGKQIPIDGVRNRHMMCCQICWIWQHVGEAHMDRGCVSGCMQPPMAIKLMGIGCS